MQSKFDVSYEKRPRRSQHLLSDPAMSSTVMPAPLEDQALEAHGIVNGLPAASTPE